MKRNKKIFLGILILSIILISVWSFFIEPNFIKIEEISIKIENLPPSFKGIKIAHLSDFHSKKFGKRERKVLKILSDLNPNFIFITGDIINWNTKNLSSCQIFWKELSKNFKNKIFVVYGNHDHWNRNFQTFDEFFRESGIKVLNNQSEKIEKNGEFIYLIGVDDPNLGYDNLSKAMGKIEINDKNPKILLAHSPEIFRKIKNSFFQINLILTGHTHGGQVDIPFLTNLILPLKYDKKYKRGFFKESLTHLYVNRGVGFSGLPMRLNCFPEITLFAF